MVKQIIKELLQELKLVLEPHLRVKLRVMLDTDVWDGINHEILQSGRVAVTTKSIKQRNGNGGLFGTLNVEIKYRRYDRI